MVDLSLLIMIIFIQQVGFMTTKKIMKLDYNLNVIDSAISNENFWFIDINENKICVSNMEKVVLYDKETIATIE